MTYAIHGGLLPHPFTLTVRDGGLVSVARPLSYDIRLFAGPWLFDAQTFLPLMRAFHQPTLFCIDIFLTKKKSPRHF